MLHHSNYDLLSYTSALGVTFSQHPGGWNYHTDNAHLYVYVWVLQHMYICEVSTGILEGEFFALRWAITHFIPLSHH